MTDVPYKSRTAVTSMWGSLNYVAKDSVTRLDPWKRRLLKNQWWRYDCWCLEGHSGLTKVSLDSELWIPVDMAYGIKNLFDEEFYASQKLDSVAWPAPSLDY